MPSQSDIQQEQELLSKYRSRMARYRAQMATLGEAYAQPALFDGIEEVRRAITNIKRRLRGWSVAVEDGPNDPEESYVIQETAPIESESDQRMSHQATTSHVQPTSSAPLTIDRMADSQIAEERARTPQDFDPISWLPNFADENLRILENELMQPFYWEELDEIEPLAHEYAVAKYFHLQTGTIQNLWKMAHDHEKIIEDDDLVTEEILERMTLLLSSLQKKISLISRAMDTIPDYPLYIVITEAALAVVSSSNQVKSALLENQTIEDICLTIHDLASTLQEFVSQLQRMQQHVAQEVLRVLGKEQFEKYRSQYSQQAHHNN